ncbi:hypothetical protein EII17_08965 [Clostridiales bacterium COT073_COT-073]|nr:hypothetical protein EII17_08965 [Clostridiales bacterium COT073_COT-073]
MSKKEEIMQLLDYAPEQTYQSIIDFISFMINKETDDFLTDDDLLALEEGVAELQAGKTKSHHEVWG